MLDAYRVPKDIDEEVGLTLIFFKVSANFEGDTQISSEHIDYKWADQDESVALVQESCKTAVQKAFAHG